MNISRLLQHLEVMHQSLGTMMALFCPVDFVAGMVLSSPRSNAEI
jgi:hypothetical protein